MNTSTESLPPRTGVRPSLAALATILLLVGCGQSGDDATPPAAPASLATLEADVAGSAGAQADPPAPPAAGNGDAPPAPAEPPADDLPPVDDAPAPTPAPVAAPIVTRDALPIAGAARVGAWGPVVPWPVIPIHASLLPDGRVMSFGTRPTGVQTAYFEYSVWDAFAGTGPDSHLTLPNQTATDLFCGSNLLLPLTGDLLIAGGDINNPSTGRTTNTPNADATLFRPAANTLERAGTMQRPRWYGSAVTMSNGETYLQGGSGGNDRAEVRGVDGQFRLLTGFITNDLGGTYPRNFVAPDGAIFGLAYRKMVRIDPLADGGAGRRTDLGTIAGYTPDSSTPMVMFAPGRILLVGSGDEKAAIVDIRGATPVVKSAGTTAHRRILSNASVLADGRVALTGGSAVSNSATGVAYPVELFDPATGAWAVGPAAQRMRLYHSISLLLPDATLLTGGGGAPGPQANLNAEIYYPPYLFDADGHPKARPQLTAAPTALLPRATFRLRSPQAASIQRLTMVATGSVTHSFDRGQRFVELDFSRDGDQLLAALPVNPYDTPPGFYMLFAFDAAGTPSVARMIRIDPLPQTAP